MVDIGLYSELRSGLRFLPNRGAQMLAYFSGADELLYGGSAGGGKSALLLGLGLNGLHRECVLYRREYPELEKLIREYDSFAGGGGNLVMHPQPSYRWSDGRVMDFRAVRDDGALYKQQGKAYDLIMFDELCYFSERQYRFLINWNRSSVKGQRCRVVSSTNPPLHRVGMWLVKYWGAWLDSSHRNPAGDGELRWYAVNPSGEEVELSDYDGEGLYSFDGVNYVRPVSRSFIRASVDDNPYLGDDYKARLDMLVGMERRAFRDGEFFVDFDDLDNCLYPNKWLDIAVSRWDSGGSGEIDSIGVDCSGSGVDRDCIVYRSGHWFSVPRYVGESGEGVRGSELCGIVLGIRRGSGASVVVDMGGGYGGRLSELLEDNGISIVKYVGGSGSKGRSLHGSLRFVNKRSEDYWRFREALEPDNSLGIKLCIPDDRLLLEELSSVTYEVTSSGIKVCSKDDIKRRIGRSPDAMDALIMSWSSGDNRGSYVRRPRIVLNNRLGNSYIGGKVRSIRR